MIVLPVISVLFVFVLIQFYQESIHGKVDSRTLSMLYSIAVNTFIILLSNEALSVFHVLRLRSLLLLWLAVDFMLFIILLRLFVKKELGLPDIKRYLALPEYLFHVYSVPILIICLSVLCLAVFTVPYNWDSMTYHLTRVAHWVQNRSVAHYVCHDISQISAPPLAEFVVLHIYLLSRGHDNYVNLVQAFSYVAVIFLVYKISVRIGCNRLFGFLAVLLTATAPIIYAEALTTQVDLYSALWLLIFVYIILEFADVTQKLAWNKDTVLKLLLLGMSAGFAYLSKPSVCIAAIFFAFWLLIICVCRRDKLSVVIGSVGICVFTALIIALPEMIRNFITFHGIASASTSTGFIVSSYDIRYLFVNMLQNLIFNMLPTDLDTVNDLVYTAMLKLTEFLYRGGEAPQSLLNFRLARVSLDHDTASNPVLVWLMVLSIFAGLFISLKAYFKKGGLLRKRSEAARMEGNAVVVNNIGRGYYIVGIISMLVFCSVVQWYYFVIRYEIGYLAIVSPAVMLLFQHLFNKKKKAVYAFGCLLFAVSILTFVKEVGYHSGYASLDSVEDRIPKYFGTRGGLFGPYVQISGDIASRHYERIGFCCGPDSYEYPLWKLLPEWVERFEHVCVANETSIYDDENFVPECIIAVDYETEQTIRYHGMDYIQTADYQGTKLFELIN